tara:strand:+ start:5558 stop:5980 length:423 start_codon:yes stop_codon:yes gene_type:complete
MSYADNSKVKGDDAEVAALSLFKRNGYTVSIPFGENAPYDLVVESPGRRVYRVQVRWCNWTKGSLMVNLRTFVGRKHKTLDRDRIDAFVAWDGSEAFVIPVADTMGCKSGLSLRREPAKNGQVKGVRLAEPYRNALHLLP